MKAQELIKELGQVLRLPNLKLDESNVCRVIFDGHPVDFETLSDQNVLFLIAELGPVLVAPYCFRRMLEANRYGLETGGATLGIDPDREAVVLHRQLDLEGLDFPAFERALEIFFERLKYWKEAYLATPDEDSKPNPTDFGSHLLKI